MQRIHNILLYYLTIILRIMLYSKEKFPPHSEPLLSKFQNETEER